MSRTVRFCALPLMLVTLGWPSEADGRSTVVARFLPDVVVGGAAGQVAHLHLHYFPGDGEAIVAAAIDFDPQQLQVHGVDAALGQAVADGGSLRVSYAEQPVGAEATDTLDITLVAGASDPGLTWRIQAYSSLETEAAHTTSAKLGVQPPVEVEAACLPRLLYPGENATLEVVLRNADALGRAVTDVSWHWPDALSPLDDQAPAWGESLLPGDERSLRYRVRVDVDAIPAEVKLKGSVQTDRVAVSPLTDIPLEVLIAPQLQMRWQACPQESGQLGVLICAWQNRGAATMELAALRLEAPHGISDLKVEAGSLDVAITREGQQIDVTGPVSLRPRESLPVELRFTPERPGPFQWQGWYRPAGHPELIPAAGQTRVEVILAQGEESSRGQGGPQLTDVEMVNEALCESLGRVLADLPLGDGARVELEADASSQKNWIVEDALTHALMAQGYRPVLENSGQTCSVLHYRLVEAKVVYTPRRGGWNPFRDGYRRESYGDVLLKLEDGGAHNVVWARSVAIRDMDEVSSDAHKWLGSAKAVDRTEVEPDYRVVEMSLSGLIVGGLFFVFFVP